MGLQKTPPKPHIKHTKYLQINSLTLKNKQAHHTPNDLIFLLEEALYKHTSNFPIQSSQIITKEFKTQ